jgi:hypothetical protein
MPAHNAAPRSPGCPGLARPDCPLPDHPRRRPVYSLRHGNGRGAGRRGGGARRSFTAARPQPSAERRHVGQAGARGVRGSYWRAVQVCRPRAQRAPRGPRLRARGGPRPRRWRAGCAGRNAVCGYNNTWRLCNGKGRLGSSTRGWGSKGAGRPGADTNRVRCTRRFWRGAVPRGLADESAAGPRAAARGGRRGSHREAAAAGEGRLAHAVIALDVVAAAA